MTTDLRRRQHRLIPISLLQFAAGGAFTPFAFLYLSRDQGLTYPEIGQIFVVASLVSAVMPIFLGVVADRYIAADRLLVGVHLAGAVCIALLAFQTGYLAITLVTVIWFALWNASNSLYNAVCFHNLDIPREEFGVVRGWGSFGWVLPLVPIWFWHFRLGNEELTFVLFVTAGIHVAVGIVGRSLPHTPPGGGRRSRADSLVDDPVEELPFSRALARLLRRPEFWILLASSCCMFWSLNVMFFYSPLLFKNHFDIHQQWIGLIHGAGIPIEILLFVVLHRVLRRIGYLGALVLGSIAMVVRHVLLAYSDSLALLIASYALPAIAVPFFLTAQSLAVNVIADRHVRASAQAILTVVGAGLMSALCHWSSGEILGEDGAGLTRVFVIAALVSALPLVLLPMVHFAENKRLGFFAPPRDEP